MKIDIENISEEKGKNIAKLILENTATSQLLSTNHFSEIF